MKKLVKMFLLFIIFFIGIIDCKAEMSSLQEEDVAAFAKNMILKSATEHADDRGFPLIAYSQGNRRNEGMAGQLSWFAGDAHNVNSINANKWAFDCSSFASYVYNKTLGIRTYQNSSARPWTVSDFVASARQGTPFYNVLVNTNVNSINYDSLHKGDLIIIVGEHIMVYVGDGLIAHVSTSAIAKNKNLGSEVVDLKSKYPGRRVNVIRLISSAVDGSVKANTVITWPDTKKQEDIGAVDNPPVINTSIVSNEKNRVIKITITDDKGIKGVTVSKSASTPQKWTDAYNKLRITTEYTVTQNGDYYVHAIDTKNQTSVVKVSITNIYKDTNNPVINNIDYTYNQNGTFNITVNATDESKMSYSLDGVNYQESNYFTNVSKNKYTIYVRDAYGNISKKDFDISASIFPTINVSYSQKYAKTITLNISFSAPNGLLGYVVKGSSTTPKESEYVKTQSNSLQYEVKNNGTFYIWVMDNKKITSMKKIAINNIDNTGPTVGNLTVTKNKNDVTIKVSAIDLGCGVEGYSLDGINYQNTGYWQSVNYGNIKIYAKDSCGNVTLKTINVSKDSSSETSLSAWQIIYYVIILLLIIFIIYVFGGSLISALKKRR